MLLNRGLVIFSVALLLWAIWAAQPASAAQVVAIGASNTIGAGQGRHHGGVVPSEAWPAQLDQLLHAHGTNVQVKNAGLAGDTTCNMLSRLDGELGPDTKVVIIQPGGNDAWKGGCASSPRHPTVKRPGLTERKRNLISISKFMGRVAQSSNLHLKVDIGV